MFVSIHLNCPGGFVLDYVEKDLYMYRAFLHNKSLNYVVGTDDEGNVNYVHISEKGSTYNIGSFIIKRPMTFVEALTSRRTELMCENLIPSVDLSTEEYSRDYHRKMENQWLIFKYIMEREGNRLVHMENPPSFRFDAIKWNTIKEFQFDSNLDELKEKIGFLFRDNCEINRGVADNTFIVRFRDPIALGQLEYSEAAKVVNEVYKNGSASVR
jgi:hypothetical protein